MLAQLEEAEPGQEPALNDPQLSFQLARMVPDLEFRPGYAAHTLGDSAHETTGDFLAEYLPKQRYIARLKRVVPMNGHGQHPPAASGPE